MRGEKTSEKVLFETLEEIDWPSPVAEFTCIDPVCVTSELPRYSIFVELLEDCDFDCLGASKEFDSILCRKNPIYQSFLEKGSIEPAQIHLVKPGTFMLIHQDMVKNGTGINQVKIPRVTRFNSHNEILHQNKK